MRSRFHAPIVWDRERNGYCFTALAKDAPRYELPGLWFNASEMHALLTMLHLLRNLEPGMLREHVEPLRDRLIGLLGSTSHAVEEIEKRIRILHMTARRMKLRALRDRRERVAQAQAPVHPLLFRAGATRRPSATFRRSGSCTTARTGTWTRGAT